MAEMAPPPLDLELARRFVDYLNKAAAVDRDTLLFLIENRTRCSEDFPAVAFKGEDGDWGVGILGMFNWMCGRGPSGLFPIAAHIDHRTEEDGPAPPFLRGLGIDTWILRGFSIMSNEKLGLPIIHPTIGWPIYCREGGSGPDEVKLLALLPWKEGDPEPPGLRPYLRERYQRMGKDFDESRFADDHRLGPGHLYSVGLDSEGKDIGLPATVWRLIGEKDWERFEHIFKYAPAVPLPDPRVAAPAKG